MPKPVPNDSDVLLAQDILNIFDQQDEDGEYLFEDEEVRHVLPLLILGAGLDAADASPAVQELMGEFALAAGLDLDAPDEEVERCIQAFYDTYPPSPEMLDALGTLLREHLGAAADVVARASRRLTGHQESHVPVGAAGAVEGSVKGGALARLNAGSKLDEKKAKGGKKT